MGVWINMTQVAYYQCSEDRSTEFLLNSKTVNHKLIPQNDNFLHLALQYSDSCGFES